METNKNESNIYPMAYRPNVGVKRKIYYIGFPDKWKKKLIELEKKIKPNWNGVYGLPTYVLKNIVNTWLDGVVDMSVLRPLSKDEKWLISCEKIDVNALFELIKIWITSNYVANPKNTPTVKEAAKTLLSELSIEDLIGLQGSETVELFDENGRAKEKYSYTAFSLFIVNELVGKEIQINDRCLKLNYAGKNELVTNIIGEGNKSFSYVIKFSLQTTPPDRKVILLCDCSIRRWIPSIYKDPYTKYTVGGVLE